MINWLVEFWKTLPKFKKSIRNYLLAKYDIL